MSLAADHTSDPAGASMPSVLEQRVLIVAPTREDAQACSAVLEGAGLQMTVCHGTAHACQELVAGAAVLLLMEESLAPEQDGGELAEALARQPAWSDLPVLVLTRGGAKSALAAWVTGHLDNAILLERPVHALTLLSAVRAAVKARQRQYQLREYLAEQQRQQEALLRSEQRFRTVAENAQAVVGIVQGQRFVYVNPFLTEISGYSEEEILAMDFIELVRSDYRELVADYARRRQLGEAVPRHYEVAMLTKDGGSRWIDLSVGAIIFNGQPAIVGTGYDVTERKRVTEALRTALVESQRFREALENVPAYVFMKDLQLRHIYANRLTLKLFGCTAEEVVGRDDSWFFPPDSVKWLREVDQRVIAGRSSTEEFVGGEVGGRRRVYLEYKTPIYAEAEGKTICGLLGIATDITQRKEAEEELAAAKAAAEAANAAKDHFLAVLSHELRTPLTPVLPLLEELARQVPMDAREDVEMAHRNVELEARLIDDLLDVTRISRGKIELHRQSVDLCTVVRRAAEVCAPDIEARRLHFGIELEGGPHLVEADPARLQQVFWNLLQNAIKFTPHGGCVAIRCERDDGQVVAEVRDSGIGIEPAALARIFHAFEQVDRTVTRQFGGLGLGLAISKALVELHGGTIEAQSEGTGKGATFTVKLPIHEVAQTPAQGPEAGRTDGRMQVGAPARPLRILLVEDHGDTVRVMRRMLQGRGHEVETAGDVATALELVQERSFDLVLSDLGLPDRSGLELMQELHQMGRDIPGIALSGYGQDEDIRRSREVGFLEHLIKPVNLGQLEAAIGRVANARV